MNSTDVRRLTGMAGVFIASMLWGTTGTAATFAPELSPLAIGAVAMGIGGLLQGLIAAGAILHQRRQIANHLPYLLTGGLAVAVYPLAFYTSMRFAGVAIGTVISIGSAPLLSALIEYRLDGGLRLSRKWMCGATLGVSGIVLLGLAESSAKQVGTGDHATAGILLALVAGFTYAFYSWSARRLMQEKIAPRAVMGVTFSAGGVLLMPVLLMTGAPLLHSWTNAAVGMYMALVPMFIGYICYGMGLARMRASTATTITLLEPVVAAVLAVMVVGEKLPPEGWFGIGLIVTCLVIITVPSGMLTLRPARNRASGS
ncbi:MAG: EamA family transporter [Desulfobulbus sp.]|nr:EamA family transporter [Desulfobulbus sp.]